jgi:hypothetical protein
MISCIVLAIAAAAPDFSTEPGIAQVQEAALRYHQVNPERVDSLRGGAESKAWLPVFELSGGLASSDVADDTTNYENSKTEPWVVRAVDGDSKDLRAKFTWNLPLLAYNPEVLDVAALNARAQNLLKEVTETYFARRRLQIEMALKPATDEFEVQRQALRLAELTSLLDAMTGGWYSRRR